MSSEISPPAGAPQVTGDDAGTDRVWRIADMSPQAVEAARAAARRAGMPLAAWLSGLIHAVADHEDAEDGPALGQ